MYILTYIYQYILSKGNLKNDTVIPIPCLQDNFIEYSFLIYPYDLIMLLNFIHNTQTSVTSYGILYYSPC